MAKIPCKGKTAKGAACQAPAGSGGFCFFHANPASAKALGQIGGRKNRRSAVDLQVPDNMTATDLCKVNGQAIRLLLSGELKARDASALAQLSNCIYRGLPIADLEARVARLEQQRAEQENRTSVDTDPTNSRKWVELGGEKEAQPDNVETRTSADGEEGGSDRPDEEEKA